MMSQNIFNSLTAEQKLRFAIDTVQKQQTPQNVNNSPQQPVLVPLNNNPGSQTSINFLLQNLKNNSTHPPQNLASNQSENSNEIQPNKFLNEECLKLLHKIITENPQNNKKNSLNETQTLGLLQDKTCLWPECHAQHSQFDNYDNFLQFHLMQEHVLDEKSHGQVIKQMHFVKSLESELDKQKNLLNNMLVHLNNQMVIILTDR